MTKIKEKRAMRCGASDKRFDAECRHPDFRPSGRPRRAIRHVGALNRMQMLRFSHASLRIDPALDDDDSQGYEKCGLALRAPRS